MRRAILLSLIILLSLPMTSATEISSNEDYDSTGTLSGDYTVASGNTWTISGDYDVAKDTAIVIEEGAVMEVTGNLDVLSVRYLEMETIANVSVPIEPSIRGLPGTLSVNFELPKVYPMTIEIEGEEFDFGVPGNNGTKFDWNGDLDNETIIVNITNYPFDYFPKISNITLLADDPAVDPVILGAEDLSGPGTTLVTLTQTWNIDVQGTLIVSGMIVGAAIDCSGTCTLSGADMQSTGPIRVTGAISVTNSNLAGGITDEDVIIYDDATIEWVDSTGTGGQTDQWVNILTTRTIGVQNSTHVCLVGSGFGYQGFHSASGCDLDGDGIIDLDLSERGRMVRWQDSSGITYVESANLSVAIGAIWGPYWHNVSNLPRVNHYDVNIELPMLSFDSLVMSDTENEINSRLGVMATISNSGPVRATNVNIDCFSNGEVANIGLMGITHTIEAGETIEIPMNWDSPTEGEFPLECSIFIPPEFEGIQVSSKESIVSEKVTWTEESEDAESMMLPIIIGVVAASVLFFVVMGLKSKGMKESEMEKDTSEDEHDFDQTLDEDQGTIE